MLLFHKKKIQKREKHQKKLLQKTILMKNL
jgi:hypothetical protein